MPSNKERLEAILFDIDTRNMKDNVVMRYFRKDNNVVTKYQAKPRCMRIRPRPLKDIHALTDWRVPNLPFDLFQKPKDIIRRNPYEVQKPYGKPPDHDRKMVQMTRPRCVRLPNAVILDDVEDGARKILTDNMYQISSAYNTRGVYTGSQGVVAPLSGVLAPPNPLQIPKLRPPYVSPEWRMDSVTWDNRQIRTCADSTEAFWLARTPNCDACKTTAAVEEMRKLKQKR